jgi:hypothetical protein
MFDKKDLPFYKFSFNSFLLLKYKILFYPLLCTVVIVGLLLRGDPSIRKQFARSVSRPRRDELTTKLYTLSMK